MPPMPHSSGTLRAASAVLVLVLSPLPRATDAAQAIGRSINSLQIIATEPEPVTQDTAVKWLLAHKPSGDGVSDEFLKAQAAEAITSRNTFDWAKAVPADLFMEYVLPYTNFDEKPEPWRANFSAHLKPLLRNGMSLKEAASAVQGGIWTAFDGPPIAFKANSTPQVLSPMSDVLVHRYGSCTALSIFLVDGLRACGIPARVVGVSVWNRPDKGNHNWVEAWFDGRWNFADAVPGEHGWNHAWFEEDVRRGIPKSLSGVYAPTWVPGKATGAFAVPWRQDLNLPAIELTTQYQAELSHPPSAWLPASARTFLAACLLLFAVGAWLFWYWLRTRGFRLLKARGSAAAEDPAP